jgi:hypothetical protein
MQHAYNFPDRLQPYPFLPLNAGSRGTRHTGEHHEYTGYKMDIYSEDLMIACDYIGLRQLHKSSRRSNSSTS